MYEGIQKNLHSLTNQIINLESVINLLIQDNILTVGEKEKILNETTSAEKNFQLLKHVTSRDWSNCGDHFLLALRRTKNDHCADLIEGKETNRDDNFKHRTKAEGLDEKWWPEEMSIVTSFYERKRGDKLLVEVLREKLISTESKGVVVIHPESTSRGLVKHGGIGKSLTAKWYAHTYEKYYNHIIWINLGENKEEIIRIFQKLCDDLKIKADKLVYRDEYAKECFKKLRGYDCLWIFDNAETYRDVRKCDIVIEKGIKDLLETVKKNVNIHCLVTSRHCDWGSIDFGYGGIAKFPLDVFNIDESVDFLRNSLSGKVIFQEYQLRELCILLENLPLALQLALATLLAPDSAQQIHLRDYISQVREVSTNSIVEGTTDDYERTINCNIQVSLKAIREQKQGLLALNIMGIFAYLQPDDIPSELFWLVANDNYLNTILLNQVAIFHPDSLNEAIHLLQKYSLININSNESKRPYRKFDTFIHRVMGYDKLTVQMSRVSVHRLIQQVFRLMTNRLAFRKYRIIEKILRCDGFLDFKFTPYMYASNELKEKYKSLRALLINEEMLIKLLKNKRFEEAIQQAELMVVDVNTPATKINHAVCMQKGGDICQAAEVLKECYENKVSKPSSISVRNFDNEVQRTIFCNIREIIFEKTEIRMNIVKMNVSKEDFDLHLKYVSEITLPLLCEKGHFSEALDLLACIDDISLWLRLLEIKNIPGYYLSCSDRCNFVDFATKSNIKECNIAKNSSEPILKFPRNLDKLIIQDISGNIELRRLQNIRDIRITNCTIFVNRGEQLSPREITLKNVSTRRNGQRLEVVNIEEFVSLHQTKVIQANVSNEFYLKLNSSNNEFTIYLENCVIDIPYANTSLHPIIIKNISITKTLKNQSTKEVVTSEQERSKEDPNAFDCVTIAKPDLSPNKVIGFELRLQFLQNIPIVQLRNCVIVVNRDEKILTTEVIIEDTSVIKTTPKTIKIKDFIEFDKIKVIKVTKMVFPFEDSHIEEVMVKPIKEGYKPWLLKSINIVPQESFPKGMLIPSIINTFRTYPFLKNLVLQNSQLLFNSHLHIPVIQLDWNTVKSTVYLLKDYRCYMWKCDELIITGCDNSFLTRKTREMGEWFLSKYDMHNSDHVTTTIQNVIQASKVSLIA